MPLLCVYYSIIVGAAIMRVINLQSFYLHDIITYMPQSWNFVGACVTLNFQLCTRKESCRLYTRERIFSPILKVLWVLILDLWAQCRADSFIAAHCRRCNRYECILQNNMYE